MWKIITRGIRETFERRVCRTNVYSQPTQDNAKNEVKTNLTCQQKLFAPIYVGWSKEFCGSSKSAGAKDKERNDKWDAKHTWPEAISWSSILAAGWVACQTLCLQKTIFDTDTNGVKKKLLFSFDYETRHNGVNFIRNQIKNWQLKLNVANVLPVTNCVGNNNSEKLPESNLQDSVGKPFGPITIEEALKEAADEFKHTHNIVIGEFELRYGIKALEEKRYKDAWMHFSQGAQLSSPGSMFNLALCYELGIGTLADPKKAVKYYNDAAVYDHAGALYNLGVYHAQGKAGLPVDISTARTYFTRAAKLGQVQAQRALDLEKTHIQLKKNDSSPAELKTPLKSTSLESNKTNDMREKLIDTMTNFIAKSARDAPGYNERIAHDSARLFIDFLSFKEPSQAAIITATDNCVPC